MMKNSTELIIKEQYMPGVLVLIGGRLTPLLLSHDYNITLQGGRLPGKRVDTIAQKHDVFTFDDAGAGSTPPFGNCRIFRNGDIPFSPGSAKPTLFCAS